MKTAIIIGSTGLVGSRLLSLAATGSNFEKIYAIARNRPDSLPEKVGFIDFDAGRYSIPPGVDCAFCCLGTTMKKAGSKEAFLKVDLEMVTNFASKCKAAGIERLAVVSSVGASAKSANFYLQTKGRMELQIENIDFQRLVIVRPSLLLGERNEKRTGEDVGKIINKLLGFLMVGKMRRYRGIDAEKVAKAMITLIMKGEGKTLAESEELEKIASAF